nr:EOG090X0DT2 [Triops cancriformis]
MENYTVVTKDVVQVNITSSISSIASERKYNKAITIGELKGKLELITGGNSQAMKLEIYDKENQFVCELNDDTRMFGSYPVDDNMRIHVIDNTQRKGEYEDVSKVEKFELDYDTYAKRTDTVRAYLERNKQGKYNEEEMKKKEEEQKRTEAEEEALANAITVGSRCEVRVPGQPARRGEVKYAGQVEFSTGYWVGVQYDEPLGKNDGSVGGKRYFTCQPKYGSFAKPHHVTVGDFPEEDFMDDLDEL